MSSSREIMAISISAYISDILVIGVGDKSNQVDPSVLDLIRRKGISLEVLPTEHACTTFNFLNVERRSVAAALIPPRTSKLFEKQQRDAAAQKKKEESREDDNP